MIELPCACRHGCDSRQLGALGVKKAVGSSRMRISAPVDLERLSRISRADPGPTTMFHSRLTHRRRDPERSESRASSDRRGGSSSTPAWSGSLARTMFSATVMTGISMKCWSHPDPVHDRPPGQDPRGTASSNRISPPSALDRGRDDVISVRLDPPAFSRGRGTSPGKRSKSIASWATTPGKTLRDRPQPRIGPSFMRSNSMGHERRRTGEPAPLTVPTLLFRGRTIFHGRDQLWDRVHLLD